MFGFPNPESAPIYYRKLSWVELRPFPCVHPSPRQHSRAGCRVATSTVPTRPARRRSGAGRLVPASGQPQARRRANRCAGVVTLDRFGRLDGQTMAGAAPASLGHVRHSRRSIPELAILRRPLWTTTRSTALTAARAPPASPSSGQSAGRLADVMELMVPPWDRSGARLLLAHAIWMRGRTVDCASGNHQPATSPSRCVLEARLSADAARSKPKAYSFGVCVLDRSRVPNVLPPHR